MIPSRFLQYKALVQAAAARYGWDAALLAAQAHAESAWNEKAVSSCGAQGLMQFMPATWKEYGKGNPFDPAASLDAGTRYMKALYAQFKDMRLALAAYNAGPGNVNKAISRAGNRNWSEVEPFLPKETRNYVPKILQFQGIYKALGQIKAALPTGLVVLLILGGAFMVRRFA